MNKFDMCRVDELVDYLLGTSIDLEDGCEACGFDIQDLSEQERQYFESKIFLCESCGYWTTTEDQYWDWEDQSQCGDCWQENYTKYEL